MQTSPLSTIVTVVVAVALSSLTPPCARGQTTDSIIGLNVAARGGLAALRAIRTERLVGRIELAPGISGIDSVELERPRHIRTTIHIGSRLLIQASDGRITWTLNPFAGDTAAHAMSEDAARNVEAGADIDGPLVDYAAKGNRVAYAGIDTADGRPAYALDVVTAAGLHDRYYIDLATHLQTKWTGRRVSDGDTTVIESFFRDYRRVDGVMLAFRIDSDTPGRPGSQHIVFRAAALNVPIDDARFRLPR